MSTKQEKIDAVVSERRVKLHRFNPSQREIWTIVGKEKEHWIDPQSNFCSCVGYYFGMIKNNSPCYHLESISLAKKENKFEIIEFNDDEYESFISGIVSDL
jgi:predicted nucleic acid-binding Zn finger protein